MILENLQISSIYTYSKTDLQARVLLTHIVNKKDGIWYRFRVQKIYYLQRNPVNHPVAIILNQENVLDHIFDKDEIIHKISEL